MRDIDWPLAITLAVVFVVMSIVRWRYFRSLARRRARHDQASGTDRVDRTDTVNGVDPPAP
jgi:membrane protein implicated in regulation of membrane protease activity